jgi:predicted transcriptional regulator
MRAKDQSQDVSLVTNKDIIGIDEAEALEGIKRGMADVEAGRVTPLGEFKKELPEEARNTASFSVTPQNDSRPTRPPQAASLPHLSKLDGPG